MQDTLSKHESPLVEALYGATVSSRKLEELTDADRIERTAARIGSFMPVDLGLSIEGISFFYKDGKTTYDKASRALRSIYVEHRPEHDPEHPLCPNVTEGYFLLTLSNNCVVTDIEPIHP